MKMPKTILRYAVRCLPILSICLTLIQAQETRHTIQIASTPSKSEATAMVGNLKAKGLEAYWVKAEVPGKGTRYRIRIGRFNSSPEAKAMAESARERGAIKDFIITSYESPSTTGAPSSPLPSKTAKSRPDIFIKRKQLDPPDPAKTEKPQPAKAGPSSNHSSQAPSGEISSSSGRTVTAAEIDAAKPVPPAPGNPSAPSGAPKAGDESGSKTGPNAASAKIADSPEADAIIDFAGDNNNWKIVKRSAEIDKNLRAIYFVDAMTGWAAGDAGAVVRTTDGGRTWKPLPSSIRANLYSISFIDWNHGWMLGQTEGPDRGIEENDGQTVLFITRNGGRTWTHKPLPQVLALYFVDLMNGWAVGKGATVLKTTDGGEQWSQVAGIEKLVGLPIDSSSYNFGFRDIFFLDAKHGWMVGNFYGRARTNIGGLFVTADGGQSWKRVPVTLQTQYSSGRFTPGRLQSVRFTDLKTGSLTGEMQDGEGRFFFALHTRDGGQSWNQFRTPSRAAHSTQFLSLANGWTAATALREGAPRDDEAEAAVYDTTLMRTDNGGLSWRNDFVARGRRIHNLFFLTSRRGWAVGDQGIILCYEEKQSVANK